MEDVAFSTHIDSVLCTVDTTTFDEKHYEAEAARLQVEAADVILLTKTDLADTNAVAETEVVVRSMMANKKTPMIRADHGNVRVIDVVCCYEPFNKPLHEPNRTI